MKNHPKYELYEVNHDVTCCRCGNNGAVKRFGQWYPNGIGNEAENSISRYKKEHKEKSFMNHYLTPGGTSIWECTNCNNIGTIDCGLEGYNKAFETIPEGEV